MTYTPSKPFKRTLTWLAVPLAFALVLLAWRVPAQLNVDELPEIPRTFFTFVQSWSPEEHQAAREKLSDAWEPSLAAFALDTLRFARQPSAVNQLVDLLEEKSGEAHGYDVMGWRRWLWNQPEHRHPHYADFKAALLAGLDIRFVEYFDDNPDAIIRLDEVMWGGVQQDGIPPLRNPKMIAAGEADYLADDNVVFGIEVDGDARAYPKRILAWHEMFTDTIAGQPLAGVYCTLCGTVILYDTRVDGVDYEVGTSGFLYRSNKLMYDRATSSLWNTFQGRPVVGPLVGKGIELPRRSVVTTTWGEWRRRHPETTVLSLDTGHRRDYGEGVAYNAYFGTDDLMFPVPSQDKRLANKAEILALLLPGHEDKPLAISADYLAKNPVWHDEIAEQRLVVLTDPSGANRAYAADDVTFASYDGDVTARSDDGATWRLSEAKLVAEDGRVLHRVPYHRAFWFGWYAVYPHTRLVM